MGSTDCRGNALVVGLVVVVSAAAGWARDASLAEVVDAGKTFDGAMTAARTGVLHGAVPATTLAGRWAVADGFR